MRGFSAIAELLVVLFSCEPKPCEVNLVFTFSSHVHSRSLVVEEFNSENQVSVPL